MEDTLFCDESFLSSPPSSPDVAGVAGGESAAIVFCGAGEEELESVLRSCLRRQHGFLPLEGYVEKLRRSPELARLRLRAARWIVGARLQLDLTIGTAFAAISFLDRFVSMYTHLKWEGWMMELLSVACLSIAAKFDEVLVSSLHSFPVEDMDHSFHPNTIQQMELTVLSALDWRLNCVTAYSFVAPLTLPLTSLRSHLRRAAGDRAAELLAGASLDLEFLMFSPFAVAVSSARRAVEELAPPETAAVISDLARLIPPEHAEETETCYRCMEERVADKVNGFDFSAASPVTVIVPDGGGAAIDAGVFSEMDILLAKNNHSGRSHSRKRKNSDSLCE